VPDASANAQAPNIDTFPGGYDDDNYDTFQVAFQRRFTQDFFVQTSFDYQLRNERRRASAVSTSPLVADPLSVLFWQNHNPSVDDIQDNSNWNFRLGRYVFQGNRTVREPAGRAAGPAVIYLGARPGTQLVFSRTSTTIPDTVTLVDIRVEKGFTFGAATN
jgi:hypothetical protein